MRKWARLGLTAAVIGMTFLSGPQALPHHAFAQTYVPDKFVTIEGRVVEFLFRNPHSVVLVEARVEKGQRITWAVEWSDAGQLSRSGIDKNTLKPGDRVIVTGNPSRNSAERRMRMQSLTRPSDGWRWSGGSQ